MNRATFCFLLLVCMMLVISCGGSNKTATPKGVVDEPPKKEYSKDKVSDSYFDRNWCKTGSTDLYISEDAIAAVTGTQVGDFEVKQKGSAESDGKIRACTLQATGKSFPLPILTVSTYICEEKDAKACDILATTYRSQWQQRTVMMQNSKAPIKPEQTYNDVSTTDYLAVQEKGSDSGTIMALSERRANERGERALYDVTILYKDWSNQVNPTPLSRLNTFLSKLPPHPVSP